MYIILPLTTGISYAIKIISGQSLCIRSNACDPDTAIDTRYLPSTSAFMLRSNSGLSSINKYSIHMFETHTCCQLPQSEGSHSLLIIYLTPSHLPCLTGLKKSIQCPAEKYGAVALPSLHLQCKAALENMAASLHSYFYDFVHLRNKQYSFHINPSFLCDFPMLPRIIMSKCNFIKGICSTY